MRLRHQLPAYSPLDASALVRGFLSALRSDRGFGERAAQHLRETFEGSRVFLTDSGTSALRLALKCLEERLNGPVALPAYGCYDIATAAIGAGVDITWYDVDTRTLGPDSRSLEQALRNGATGVVVAHLYGIPLDMASVARLCSEHGAVLIEDAAQGYGGFFRGHRLGTIGSLGVLSFGRGKGVTGGSGGALLGNDELGAAVVDELEDQLQNRQRGWTVLLRAQLQWLLGRPGLYWLPKTLPTLRLGETIFREPWEPRRESAAALGILSRTVDLADNEVAQRRLNARRLIAAAEPKRSCLTIRPADESGSTYLRLPLLWQGAEPREAAIAIASRLGVAAAYPRPLNALSEVRSRALNSGARFRGAERLARTLFTIPTHSLLTERDLAGLERWIRGLD